MAKPKVSKPVKICKVEGCSKETSVRGYCGKHYEALRVKGTFSDRTCKIPDCDGFPVSFGLCSKHYQRKKDLGSEYARSKFDPNEIVIRGDVCEIQLYDSKNQPTKKAIVDVDNKWKVEGLKWGICKGKTSEYVSRNCREDKRALHHLIISVPDGFDVDHINGDTLDNRRSNLRVATRGQNNANSKLLRKTNKSGYRGVCWSKQKGKYIGQIQYSGKHEYLGSSNDPKVIARRYDDAAKELFGEFATLNGV